MTHRLRFTEEMTKAGMDAAYSASTPELNHNEWFERVFRAMLNAAPLDEYKDEFIRLALSKRVLARHHASKAESSARLAEWMASE